MSFKENLLKKIQIDKMADKVINSVGSPGSGKKIDEETMLCLLDMGAYKHRKERDLDLYISDSAQGNILVLDNELAFYSTTAEDVALRKSPTVKEMISIRNVVKILSDSDVIVSKREDSVRTVQNECIAMLDISFDESDIEIIKKDGIASFERDYTDGVIECFSLFEELLEYSPAPAAFKISNNKIIGPFVKKEDSEVLFGPVVIYSLIHNTVKLVEEQISSLDKQKIEFLHKVAAGKEKACSEGASVFEYLEKQVVSKKNKP
ncbi:MAG: hypothetical protein GY749_17995 [Desulfobacteraceae bacterium]|nr:hypothetical protein [Desulfobacteraceae bacterium]